VNETPRTQSSPPVFNRPPVVCDGHDVAMVRDVRFMGWRCPEGDGWLGEGEYHRLISPLGSRPDLTDVRVTGCGESP
jgi:hypothetical protein